MERLGVGNLPLTGATVQSKEMKKGTAKEFLSKMPTEAVSGLIFVSVLQSLDSQNWLTQHTRYASASPGYFGFLETAQRSVLTKILQMCQIFYAEWEAEAPQIENAALPAAGLRHGGWAVPWVTQAEGILVVRAQHVLCVRSKERGSHKNKLAFQVWYCFHKHSKNVNKASSFLNTT